MADFLTIKEEFGDFKDVVVTFIGDGNNVANSLILCGAILGVEVRIACPKGYEPDSVIIEQSRKITCDKSKLKITDDPISAVKGFSIQMYGPRWEKKLIKKIRIRIFADSRLIKT